MGKSCNVFYGFLKETFGVEKEAFKPFRDDKAHACAQWIALAKTFLI